MPNESLPRIAWSAAHRRPAQVIALAIAVLACFSSCSRQPRASREFPRKPIKVVVPFSAGGGSDTFTRIIQSAVERHSLLPSPLVVINVPGASGTIGSRRVKNARPDGYTILQLHEGILSNKYSGNVPFGPEAFTPIAGTGQMSHVIAVRDDSPFKSILDLTTAARQNPHSIVFAVGIGAPSHYAGLLLEKSANDAKFRFTQSGGGAKRFASLLGGHTDVTTFSLAEFLEFQSSGLRALAILSEERHAMGEEIPTAREQGLDVVSTNMHFWWAPKGTPPDRIETIAQALQKAMQIEGTQQQLRDLATDPMVVRDELLTQNLHQREIRIAGVAPRATTELPNFPAYVLAGCGLVAILAVRRRLTDLICKSDDPPSHQGRTHEANRDSDGMTGLSAVSASHTVTSVGLAVLLVGYVAMLTLGLVGFRTVTLVFVWATMMLLLPKRPASLAAATVVAVGLSFGLHSLFTEVLVIDLP